MVVPTGTATALPTFGRRCEDVFFAAEAFQGEKMMALKDREGYYAKFTYVENGQVLTRRIHKFDLQARDGQLYHVEGKDLPDGLTMYAGAGRKGNHLAELILPKSALRRRDQVRPPKWPNRRDWVHVATGASLLVIFHSVLILAATVL